MIRRLFWLIVLLTVLSLPAGSYSSEPPVFVRLGFEYASGDYGTDIRTDSIFAPVTIGVNLGEKWEFTLEFPYIYQSNTNVIAGQYRQMNGSRKTSTTMGTMGSGGTMGNSQTSAGNGKAGAQSGIGDITFHAGYLLRLEDTLLPQIRPGFFVKVPSADRGKGLGTGEFDEGFTIEFSKWFDNFNLFMEPGYTFQGNSPDLQLNDFWSCIVGAGYQVNDHLRPMILLKGSTPPEAGSSSLLEARLKLQYQVGKTTGIEAYYSQGITRSSPDHGIGLSLQYDF